MTLFVQNLKFDQYLGLPWNFFIQFIHRIRVAKGSRTGSAKNPLKLEPLSIDCQLTIKCLNFGFYKERINFVPVYVLIWCRFFLFQQKTLLFDRKPIHCYHVWSISNLLVYFGLGWNKYASQRKCLLSYISISKRYDLVYNCMYIFICRQLIQSLFFQFSLYSSPSKNLIPFEYSSPELQTSEKTWIKSH
jgi:hypothetical protein